jgi:hypothetical protein
LPLSPFELILLCAMNGIDSVVGQEAPGANQADDEIEEMLGNLFLGSSRKLLRSS